ncbi:MAG TPA: hypothetical protein VGL86_04150 [Polyangia bacterium]
METPMTLVMPMVRIRLKCGDVEAFVDKYHADVNMAGIFVRTRAPLAAGTPVSFDFRFADDSCLFRGSGIVIWTRADDMLAPLLDAGMMLGFDELRDGTQRNFDRVLARKRALEEAADTAPTLVRTFVAEEQRPLPMTTKLTKDELEELRSRVRTEMMAEGEVPSTPVEIIGEPVPASPQTEPHAILPMLVPAEPRESIEAKPLVAQPLVAQPLVAQPTSTPLAKVLVLRPQPQIIDGTPMVDPDDVTPLPPVARVSSYVEERAPRPDEVTALVESPSVAPDSMRLLGVGIASSMLLFAVFALIRLNLVQRMLEWISGA